MKKFKTLNKNTLEEGFRYLAKKETAFKSILEEKIRLKKTTLLDFDISERRL